MNRYDFTQPGGFPFDQGVMQFIQDCINTAAQVAPLAGPLAILSGCVVAGPSAGNGYVVINGEILPFTGGLITPKVVVVQTGAVIAYQDGTPRTTKFTRVAKFGDDGGATNYLWANFKRNTAEGILARLDRVEGLLRPFSGAGGMVWWKGAIADIPAGWQEVVAWRGRLPMAYDPADADFAIGNAEGSKTHLNTIEELAPHTHSWMRVRTDIVGDRIEDNHTKSGGDRALYTGDEQETGSTGDGVEYSILNPYRVGCWIEPIPGTF